MHPSCLPNHLALLSSGDRNQNKTKSGKNRPIIPGCQPWLACNSFLQRVDRGYGRSFKRAENDVNSGVAALPAVAESGVVDNSMCCFNLCHLKRCNILSVFPNHIHQMPFSVLTVYSWTRLKVDLVALELHSFILLLSAILCMTH